MKKMFVWEVTFDEHWSYHSKGETDVQEYTVASPTGEQAIEKAKKIALANTYEDGEDDFVEKCLSVSLIGLRQANELDG